MPRDAEPTPILRPTTFQFHSGRKVVLRGDEQARAYFLGGRTSANALERPVSRLWLVVDGATTFVTDRHCNAGQLRVNGVRVNGPTLALDQAGSGLRAGAIDVEPADTFVGVPSRGVRSTTTVRIPNSSTTT